MNCARNHLSPHCLWTAGFPQQIVRPRLIQTRPRCLSCEALPVAWGRGPIEQHTNCTLLRPQVAMHADRHPQPWAQLTVFVQL